jgi:hypothetical protein
MVRTGWLAALIVVLAPWPSLAQFGGMGGMGGGMGGMGGGMRGIGGGGRAQAQAPEEWTTKFETFNGQSVTGKIQLPSIEIACSLGLYEIRPGKIKSIQFNPAPEQLVPSQTGALREGTVLTDSGESVAGKINVPNWWRLETDLGSLTPDAQQLKTITFIGRAANDRRRVASPPRPDDAPPTRAAKPGENPPAAEPAKDPAKPGESGKPS